MSNANPDPNLTAEMLTALEADLKESLHSSEYPIEAGIVEMISHHLGWSDEQQASGKRIRPLLTLLCCDAAGGDWRQALPAASAIEWIHNFSLLHDDIQDHSEIRRGRPTVWKVWGSAQAINTGDAIFALSRLVTQRLHNHGFSLETILSVQSILDETSLALTRGQYLDISFETAQEVTTDEYLDMIQGKTAALLGAACQVGALLAAAPVEKVAAYRTFGENLGLAFQVIDDLLGVWGATTSTGKPTSDDLRMRKKTLPIIHGLETSPEFAKAWSSGEQTDIEINAQKRMLAEAGSREFTIQWAQQLTDKAMASLASAEPLEPAGSSLSSLSARLLQRVA